HVGETGQKPAEVDTRFGQTRDGWKHVGGSPVGDEVENREKLVFGHETKRIAHAFAGHVAVAHRQHLIGKTERVAHRTVRGTRDRRERIGVSSDAFFTQNVRQSLPNLSRTDSFEIETLESAEHWSR